LEGPRVIEETGSWPESYKNSPGITSGGDHCEYHNLILYNVNDNGIESWWQNKEAVISGCIIYNCGWHAPDRGHGHGIYMQNFKKVGYKNVRKNIIFNSNAFNHKIYGQSGAMNNVNVTDNIYFNAGYPSNYQEALSFLAGGGGGSPTNITFKRNYIYQDSTNLAGGVRFGYEGNNFGFAVEDNIVQASTHNYFTLSLTKWCGDEGSFKNNILSSKGCMLFYLSPLDTTCSEKIDWDYNTYYYMQEHDIFWKYDFLYCRDSTKADWDFWRKYRSEWDVHSTFTNGEIDLDYTRVIPNDYEKGRANIVIYNNSKLSYVDVDVSEVLSVGDTFYLYDVENIWEPLLTGIYDGNQLSVPMELDKIAAHPEFYNDIQHTHNVFGAYLLLTRKLAGKDISSGIKNDTTLNIQKLKIMKCFPNPSNSIVKINYYVPEIRRIALAVYNQNGVLMHKKTIQPVASGECKTEINLSTFSAGTYFLKISNGIDSDKCQIVKK
jgi:hypothetical protein